jgi:cytochrome c oxidase cbb3-type subunit IV
MFKFIKGHMDSIAGIELFPIITLLIFFTFFVGLFVWVFTYNKSKIKEMSEIPFHDN